MIHVKNPTVKEKYYNKVKVTYIPVSSNNVSYHFSDRPSKWFSMLQFSNCALRTLVQLIYYVLMRKV